MASATPARHQARMVERIARKRASLAASSRCGVCWHDRMYCICSRVQAMFATLAFRLDVRFALYLHETEWLCASDDAKLLCCAAPEHTSLFVHGNPGDDAKLAALVQLYAGRSCLLFPDDDAILVEEFLEGFRGCGGGDGGDGGSGGRVTTVHPSVLIIVVDATWRRARKMMKHLTCNVIGETPHIKLETETVSCYSRTQTQSGRICTVEAIALLLQEMGERPQICASLIDCVKLNNNALKPTQGHGARGKDLYEHGPHMKHPAWYLHSPLPVGKRGGARGAAEQGRNNTFSSASIADSSAKVPRLPPVSGVSTNGMPGKKRRIS